MSFIEMEAADHESADAGAEESKDELARVSDDFGGREARNCLGRTDV